MRFSALREALRKALSQKPNTLIYQQATSRHAALREAHTIYGAIAILRGGQKRNAALQDAILVAVLKEYQRDPRVSLWPTLLLYAFVGALIRIRAATRHEDSDPDTPAELDAQLRLSFLETAYRYPLDRRPRSVAANLVWDTRKRYLKGIRAQERTAADQRALVTYARQVSGRKRVSSADPTGFALGAYQQPRSPSADDWVDYLDGLARLVNRGDLREADADLLFATRIRRLTVPQYVDEQFPKLRGEARARAVERLKRRRHRAETALRNIYRKKVPPPCPVRRP